MKLAVVTDSSAVLPEDIQQHPDLFVIPIPVIIDGKSYSEGQDIEADAFYEMLNTSKEFPKTSQPVLGEVLALYDDLQKQGYDTVISIHLSAGISGFVSTLEAIKDDFSGLKIIPFDSRITSMPMGNMVKATLDMNDAGASLAEIKERLAFIRDNVYAYLIVDDLNNLVRGGRLTNGAALLGGLLKIKPILTFVEGKIVLFEKIRSSKKAFARAEDIVGQKAGAIDQPVQFFVIHANNLEVAKIEKAKLQEKYPEAQITIGHFGPVIGTHLGEKAIGIAISPY
ncbi:DegV family protein [Enterococcus sp.]|uniref:DegV family protein n=1 Tax=Enterococcus sp. TaxID=35783 RepID=UPI003C70BF3E